MDTGQQVPEQLGLDGQTSYLLSPQGMLVNQPIDAWPMTRAVERPLAALVRKTSHQKPKTKNAAGSSNFAHSVRKCKDRFYLDINLVIVFIFPSVSVYYGHVHGHVAEGHLSLVHRGQVEC